MGEIYSYKQEIMSNSNKRDKLFDLYEQLLMKSDNDKLNQIVHPLINKLISDIPTINVIYIFHKPTSPLDWSDYLTSLNDKPNFDGVANSMNMKELSGLTLGHITISYESYPTVMGCSVCSSFEQSLFTCYHELFHLFTRHYKLNDNETITSNRRLYRVINESAANLFAYWWYCRCHDMLPDMVPTYNINRMRIDNYTKVLNENEKLDTSTAGNYYLFSEGIEHVAFEQLKGLSMPKTVGIVYKLIMDNLNKLKPYVIRNEDKQFIDEYKEWKQQRNVYRELFIKLFDKNKH